MALALVALWPLAMNHCKLEASTDLAFFQCSDHSSGQSDCADDACATVESGFYKAENTQLPLAAVVVLFDSCRTELVLPRPLPVHDTAFCMRVAPPELPRCWQFVSRTALPVRAPSFAS